MIVYLSKHLMLLVIMTSTKATSDGVRNYLLESHPNVGWPSGLTNCQDCLEISVLSCARYCISSSTCLSMYMLLNSTLTGHHRWKCSRCDTKALVSPYPVGTGIYATVKPLGTSLPVFTAPNCTLQKTGYYNGAEAAFYDCTNNVTGHVPMRLAVDEKLGMLSQLGGLCLSTLHEQASFSASLMTMTIDDSGVFFTPQCKPGETTDGFSLCAFTGSWMVTSESGVHCISSLCHRLNANRRSIYKGFENTTVTGRVCQYWNTQSPHAHTRATNDLYIEDGFSIDNAMNYCRGLDYDGKPWCYTTDPYKRWEFCSVPECQ